MGKKEEKKIAITTALLNQLCIYTCTCTCMYVAHLIFLTERVGRLLLDHMQLATDVEEDRVNGFMTNSAASLAT